MDFSAEYPGIDPSKESHTSFVVLHETVWPGDVPQTGPAADLSLTKHLFPLKIGIYFYIIKKSKIFRINGLGWVSGEMY